MRRVGTLVLIAAALGLPGCAGAPDAAEAGPPPRPIAVSFAGLETLAAGDLEAAASRELEAFRRPGAGVSELADAVYAMETRLAEQGHWRGWVEFEVSPSEEAPEAVRFTVHEGPRAVLKKLRIKGNHSFTDEVLDRFVIPEGGLFGGEDETFRQRRLDAGVGKITDHYLVNGYQDVRVELLPIEWNEARTEAVATVQVEEGPQHVVREILYAGGVVPPERVRRALEEAHLGQPYRISRPSEMAGFVRRKLAADGFLDARVRGEVSDEGDPEKVVTLTIERGPEVFLGTVSVEGEDRTSRGFIESLLRLEGGQRLDSGSLDDTLERLYGTGLFGSVDLRVSEPREGEADAETRVADLAVQLAEIPARNVDFEIGWGSYELARGAIRYRDRNLFGIGRELDVDLHASLKAYGLEARLIDPYLLGDADRLELGGGVSFREEPVFERTRLFWDLTWRHTFGPGEDLRAGYRFNAERAEALEVAPSAEDEESSFLVEAGLFALYRLDRRDQWLAPTSGYLLEGGLFWSTPGFGADLDYLEITASASWYHELFEGTVLALGTRFATQYILDDRETLPIQNRLFLGGEFSVRSFRQDELGPFDADGEPVGGLTSFEAHAELRQHLFADLYGALFVDVGTVGVDAFDLAGPFGYGIGAGLRYLLPFGPVRLDFGYNPGDRFAAEDAWALHLSFGFSF